VPRRLHAPFDVAAEFIKQAFQPLPLGASLLANLQDTARSKTEASWMSAVNRFDA
jgi:hypothetical protein